jgi:hypothetical protein
LPHHWVEEVKFTKKETLQEYSAKLFASGYKEYYNGASIHPEVNK